MSLALLIVLGAALVSLTMVVRPRDARHVAEPPGWLETGGVEQASPGPPAGVEGPSAPAAGGATTAAPVTTSPSPAAPPAPTPPRASPVASPPPAAVPSRPVPPVAPPPDTQGRPESAYRLIARTTEPTWIRVRTEDGRTTEETIPAGAVREWVSSRPFELTVGNAGGVQLELNGTALPPLGASGAVISRLVVPAEPR